MVGKYLFNGGHFKFGAGGIHMASKWLAYDCSFFAWPTLKKKHGRQIFVKQCRFQLVHRRDKNGMHMSGQQWLFLD